ncbi:MAG: hypothetical protein P8P74_05680 [Crocinitomicaceae bacterium]|nr:hypothetical protein [Crocinitomicaceae bacterium]
MIYQKKAADLSIIEHDLIVSLLERHYPNTDKKYIEDRVSPHNDFDIVFLKNEAVIVGVSYFKVNKLKTPFSNRKIPVIHFGQVLKSPEFSGNLIWKLGHWYATKNIDLLYPVRRVVGITITSNPKVYGHFAKLFPNNFAGQKADRAMLSFLNEYFTGYTQLQSEVSDEFTMTYPDLNEKDISRDWNAFYKSKNDESNELFRRKEIIAIDEDGAISQTLNRLVCVGYRDAFRRFRFRTKA